MIAIKIGTSTRVFHSQICKLLLFAALILIGGFPPRPALSHRTINSCLLIIPCQGSFAVWHDETVLDSVCGEPVLACKASHEASRHSQRIPIDTGGVEVG